MCCSPTLWMWKLIVHTPSQISWYYTLQGIEVPESIERNIFSNVIIEGHFQCALPLQCMPEPGIMQDQKIWNYGVHFGLPLVTAVYCKFCQNLSVIRKFCETLQSGTHIKMIERELFIKQVRRMTIAYFVLWTPYYAFGFLFWKNSARIFQCSSKLNSEHISSNDSMLIKKTCSKHFFTTFHLFFTSFLLLEIPHGVCRLHAYSCGRTTANI